jgi:hypothetical protein
MGFRLRFISCPRYCRSSYPSPVITAMPLPSSSAAVSAALHPSLSNWRMVSSWPTILARRRALPFLVPWPVVLPCPDHQSIGRAHSDCPKRALASRTVAWADRAIMSLGQANNFHPWAKSATQHRLFFFHFGFHLFKSQKIIQTSKIHVNL